MRSNQGRGIVNSNDLLPPLLRAWMAQVGDHPISSPWTPWWLDPEARLRAIAQAAESLGWQAAPALDEEWDLHLATPDTPMLIRCVGAGVDLSPDGVGRDVIQDAWRVLAMTSPPPRGGVGVHLVSVEPHLAQAGDEASVRARMAAWRAAHPWTEPSVWVDAPSPMPRNGVGTAFPGLGLLARAAPS